MRQANVLYKATIAGLLTESDDGEYRFQYHSEYLKLGGKPVTLTMPLTDKPYVSNRLFAFFEGLIPEGWLLDIATKNWKLKSDDRMGLLMACCHNCIGAVSIQPIESKDE